MTNGLAIDDGVSHIHTFIRGLFVVEGHKTETSTASALAIQHQDRVGDRAILTKEV